MIGRTFSMSQIHQTKVDVTQKIEQQLNDLSVEELRKVDYFLETLASSKQGKTHLLGEFLGIKQDDDAFRMDLGFQNENVYGVAQGGAVYTLADVAIGFFIINRASEDEKVFTLELKVNFIRKGTGSYLYTKPKIIHWGRTTVVCEASILDENDRVVAHALGTFYIARD